MKTRLLFLAMALFPATAAMSQTTAQGFRATYQSGEISQTFLLDSVKSFWWDRRASKLFINTLRQEYVKEYINSVVFEYPELRLTPPQDYMVVQVGFLHPNYAAFCLDAGFEMTWNGTLEIKDSYQSQSINLKYTGLKIEQRTYGYVNPSIPPATPSGSSFYLVVDPVGSFGTAYKCIADENNLIILGNSTIKIPKNKIKEVSFSDVPRGAIYR